MHRGLALFAAVGLVASLAGSSLAAGPASQVNRFLGNFELASGWGIGESPPTLLHARVVVDFSMSTNTHLVPGRLDVYWPSGSAVRESHAQLTWAGFWDSYWTWEGTDFHSVDVNVRGSWCDYRGPGDASCRSFYMVFQKMISPSVPEPNRVGVEWDTLVWLEEPVAEWYNAGKNGAFVLTYAGPTW